MILSRVFVYLYMAQSAITVATATGSKVLIVSTIKRINTEGTGTRIFFGMPAGGGGMVDSVLSTDAIATIVNLLGNAVVALSVVSNGATTTQYFPIAAIKEVSPTAQTPANAIVQVGMAGGNGGLLDTVFVTQTVAQVVDALNDTLQSDSKFLEVAWTATQTVDLTPFLNSTDKLFINFVGTTQANTALTLTGLIPPNMEIELLFSGNTTVALTLNAGNVIASGGASASWTNTKTLTGAANLFNITAIGDNVTDKVPVRVIKPVLT